MITKITSSNTTNSYVQRIGGVSVTVNNNFSENRVTVQVEARITGGSLDTQA